MSMFSIIATLVSGGKLDAEELEQIGKYVKPMLLQKLPEFELKIKELLKTTPLQEGETHAAYTITEHKERIVFVLSAYQKTTMTRAIKIETFDVFFTSLFENLIK
jgi:hypothetical protein